MKTKETLAQIYSNDTSKETIQCPRYCKNPGGYFGFIHGYEARVQEVESQRVIALINQWAAENCMREIQSLKDRLAYLEDH